MYGWVQVAGAAEALVDVGTDRIKWSRRLALALALAVGVALFAHSPAARAQQFMGCALNQPPNKIVRCLDDKRREWEADRQRERVAAEQRAQQQVREATDRLKRDLEATGKLVKSPAEQVLLEAKRKLRADPFVACVARANPGAEVAALANRFASDPQAFLKAAYDNAIAIAPEVTFAPPRIDGPPRPPTLAEIFDATWARLDRLAARSPTVRCAVELLRPHQQATKRAFVDAGPRLGAAVGRAWAGTGDAVLASIVARLVTGALDKAALGPDGTLVLKGALTEHMLRPDRIQSNADLVRALVAALPQGGAPMLEAARKAKASLDKSAQIDADFYVDLFGAWLKVAGHHLIHSDRAPGSGLPGGGWVADRLLDQLDWVPGAVNAGIGTICGLVPEVGGGVCAWAMELNLRQYWVLVIRPGLKDVSLAALEGAFDTGADLLKDKLRGTVRREAAQLRRKAGVFAQILEGMQQQLVTAFVDHVVKATRVALDNFNHSVIELVDRATAGR